MPPGATAGGVFSSHWKRKNRVGGWEGCWAYKRDSGRVGWLLCRRPRCRMRHRALRRARPDACRVERVEGQGRCRSAARGGVRHLLSWYRTKPTLLRAARYLCPTPHQAQTGQSTLPLKSALFRNHFLPSLPVCVSRLLSRSLPTSPLPGAHTHVGSDALTFGAAGAFAARSSSFPPFEELRTCAWGASGQDSGRQKGWTTRIKTGSGGVWVGRRTP
jgi:hypothetical protein